MPSFLLLLIVPLLLQLLVPLPVGAEQLIAKIILNQEDKGDFFINRMENGDFLVKTSDLKAIGFRSPTGTVSMIDQEPYLSLRSMAGVVSSFNEDTLSLTITAQPAVLGKEIIDFLPEQTQKVYYPRDSSIFLNYGADYLAGNGSSYTSFNLSNQLGIRMNDVLFLSDSVFSKDQTQERFTRLQSSFTYDDRTSLRRLSVGDFFASSGDLGSNLNLGGVSFAKVYRLDPYYIYYPTLKLAGQVSLPSEAKIYLNGMLMKTEKLSPGEFELRNLTPYGAAGTVDVVLRDSFGREQRLDYPFYFADSLLLKKGFQEYSYNLGFTRSEYGTCSNRYSDLAFSAFHRYGVSDAFTMGFHAEAKNRLYNLGPQLTFLAGHFGVFSLSMAGSTGKSSNNGIAGTTSYLYQGLNFGIRLSLSGFTRDYAVVADTQSTEKIKYAASCGLSYGNRLLGTLSLDYSTVKKYLGQDRAVATVSYNRSLSAQTSISASYRRIRENGNSNEFYISFTFTPKSDLFVSNSYEQTQDGKRAVVSVQKNPPVGEGLSYRATLKRDENDGKTTWTANPYLQYNGRYGIYEGDYEGQSADGENYNQYHLSVAGALVYIGRTFGVTRPVYDSFALVNVGGLEGVKVLLNSQDVGTTDSSGKLFIPDLSSYSQNQVAISDKDIPMDYYLSSVVKLISPPLRSGSCVPFVVKKVQPISGALSIKINGKLEPVEFQEVSLMVGGSNITFPTGSDGEFDIDLSQSDEFKQVLQGEESGCSSMAVSKSAFLKPGTYQASVFYEGKRYRFAVTIPDSNDTFVDLGQIVIDTTH